MNAERRQQIKQLFQEAVDLPHNRQAGFLEARCASNKALRAEVEKLLGASDSVMGDFLCAPAVATPPPPQSIEPAAPRVIGQYEIIRRIGEGGMGVVYEARQENTGSVVALKVIRPGLASRELLRRFDHEAQVLGRLRHPGIAQVYEAGIHIDRDCSLPFIAMELIKGQSLIEYVKAESPDMRAILRLFAKICDAVHHAHQKGVIHRDLKPGNILVSRADQTVQPKILDFGIARVTDADTLTTTLQTQTGQLIGTVKYMSPEQAAGDPAEIDIRSDVYALGVILYELLTRRMPYEVDRKLIHEAVRAIREDEARPLSSISRLYRGDLTTILGKVLDKEKTRRYQSAAELAADIRRYLNNEPVAAHAPSAWYQFGKFARRHRGFVAGVSAVFITLLVGLGLATWQAHKARLARDTADAQRQRADRRFGELRALAHAFIQDFDNKIKDLAGSTPAREFLVETALQYLNSLAEDIDPSDVVLQAELGTAYFRLGDIQGDPRVPNLGNPAGALKNYLKGLPFIEAVATAQPSSETGRDVGAALNRIGSILESMGRYEEAETYYDRALNDFTRLSRQYPDDFPIKLELAQCFRIRLDVRTRQRRIGEALGAAHRALELFESLLRSGFRDELVRHGVASTNSVIAEILEEQETQGEALPYRLKSLDALESLSRDHPHNAVFRRDFGVAAERVGYSCQRAGDLEKALPYFEKSVEIAKELVAAEPGYLGYELDLTRGLCRVGEIQLALGRTDSARSAFDLYVRQCEAFAEHHADDSRARRALGVAYYKMAELESAHAKNNTMARDQRRNHWQEARSWFRKCQGVFIDMKNRKILAPGDVGVPAELAGEIETCDAQLASLQRIDR